jgi:hypothetical protein
MNMLQTELAAAPVPHEDNSALIVAAPGDGQGYWAGSPSAALADDGSVYLAYRLRRPVGAGRGYANVVARSEDGERFETVAELAREDLDCASLERPALVPLAGGGWRLYLSCATPDSKHWRVDAVDAPDPWSFDPASARTILPGDAATAVKDPVVMRAGGSWHLWLCCHPLDVPGASDRMYTRYATSDDGLVWDVHGVALAPRAGEWDERGARVASVLRVGTRWSAYYDGRRSAEENGEERTGLATGSTPGRLTAGTGPIAVSAHGRGSLRYVSALPMPDGGLRLYYETTRLDGAHELRTEYVPAAR